MPPSRLFGSLYLGGLVAFAIRCRRASAFDYLLSFLDMHFIYLLVLFGFIMSQSRLFTGEVHVLLFCRE